MFGKNLIFRSIRFSGTSELALWICGLDCWDPLMTGIVTLLLNGTPRIPNHRAPHHQLETGAPPKDEPFTTPETLQSMEIHVQKLIPNMQ